MANDADVKVLAVVKGEGFEVVVTLGTGFGTAFFLTAASCRTWSSPTSTSEE